MGNMSLSIYQKRLLNKITENVYNVRNYGALGGGTSDDTAAFKSAVADIITKGNGKSVLYIPSGTYKLTEQIIIADSIAIKGEGLEQSILEWAADSTSQGISISYVSTRDKAHPYIGHLSFVRTNDWGGSAISIDGSTGGSHPDSQRCTIENVRIDRGNRSSSTGSWEYGIFANSLTGCYINNVSFQGDNDPDNPSTDYYGTFIRITGTDANPEVNAHFNITNTICNRANRGLYASNTEGVYLTNFRYFNNDYSIKYDNDGATTGSTLSPRIMISGGHLTSRYRGIELAYTTNAIVRDVYSLDSSAGSMTEHLLISNTVSSSVAGCHFEGLAGSTADGIKLTNSTFDTIIQGNTFVGIGANAIETDATSNANFVGHNFFRFDNWTKYVENAASHIMRVGGKYTLKLDSTQSIPNATGTVVNWGSVYENELGSGFSNLGSDAQRITIPRRGKYKITSYIHWLPNATGYRFLDIRINGGNSIGSNGLTVMATPTGNTRLTVVSNILELNANDYVTAYVEQSSGGALNIQLNSTISIEYIGSF